MSKEVRVRFAPSPTGYLHVGGARTMLFNWLYARKTGGKLVLRIEDTDRNRNTDEALRAVLDGLRWLGLHWDEGPEVGGDRGPYFQSQRNDIYKKYLNKLEKAGRIYEDDRSLRFKTTRSIVQVEDLICGRIAFDMSNPATHPDITIRRPDGGWIFHFVNVVDDIEMGITHVIRGEDHLSNTPKHVDLYHALGVEPPKFAHIPLILNEDGSKMSKRDKGAAVSWYQAQGYVPEAVVNYLCLLGWSPKDNREILPIEEVIALFDLDKINRRSARFDLDKCFWINGQYIAQMTPERFSELAIPFLRKAGIDAEDSPYLRGVLAIVKEKIKLLSDIPSWASYFFTDSPEFDPEAVAKSLQTVGAGARLERLEASLKNLSNWTAESIEAALKTLAAEYAEKPALYVHPARVAVSGRAVGPSLYHMLEVMGRERVLQRLASARIDFCTT